MDHKEVLKRVDHTLLTQAATWEEVQAICDEGMAYETASVCIPPRYVKRAADYVKNRLKICTVVGFPNGYSTPEVKVFETEDAIRNGADEIDMVMDIGLAKSGDWEGVLEEIKAVKASCNGHILKVIVEACQLTREEKIAACRVVSMPAEPPWRMWPCSGSTSAPTCASRPPAASAPLSRPRPCWRRGPTASAPAPWWPCTARRGKRTRAGGGRFSSVPLFLYWKFERIHGFMGRKGALGTRLDGASFDR